MGILGFLCPALAFVSNSRKKKRERERKGKERKKEEKKKEGKKRKERKGKTRLHGMNAKCDIFFLKVGLSS